MPDSNNALLDALANPRQVDMLGVYQGANNILRGQWAVREMQARQAAGEAYQQATNPATGEVDPAKAQAIMAANPAAALHAQSSATTGQALKSANLGFNQQQQMNIGKTLAGVLSMPDEQQTPENYRKALDFSFANHSLDQSHYDNATKALAAAGNDPAALRAFGTRIFAGTLAGPEVAGFVMPANTMVDDGQSVAPQIVRPASQGGGLRPATGAVQTYPSRASLAGRVQVGVGADGAPIYGPAANVTPPNLAGPAAGGGALGTGRLPPALVNPANPANQPPAVPNNGNVTTGLGPAQNAAQTATGTQSAGAFQTYASEGDKAVQQQSVLSSMLGDTRGFTTGPGASTMANFQRSLQRIGTVLGTSFGVNPDRVAANESFNKLASQLADAQGAGSDARLSVNKAANPHEDMSPAGVDLVIRQLQGNADYKVAKAKLASAFPNKADNIAFENQVRTNLDPRAFQFERMTPPQRKTYYAGLTEHDQKAVKAAYNWGVTNGLIGVGNAGQ